MELNRENVDFIQSASNPVAVARQLAEWSKDVLRAEGNEAVKNNVLLRAVVGKLCSLYGIEHDGNRAYEYLNTSE